MHDAKFALDAKKYSVKQYRFAKHAGRQLLGARPMIILARPWRACTMLAHAGAYQRIVMPN